MVVVRHHKINESLLLHAAYWDLFPTTTTLRLIATSSSTKRVRFRETSRNLRLCPKPARSLGLSPRVLHHITGFPLGGWLAESWDSLKDVQCARKWGAHATCSSLSRLPDSPPLSVVSSSPLLIRIISTSKSFLFHSFRSFTRLIRSFTPLFFPPKNRLQTFLHPYDLLLQQYLSPQLPF